MGNHLFSVAMEFLCHASLERWTAAASEVDWVERILGQVLLNDDFLFKCPKNVESNLELYLSVIQIQEKKKLGKTEA